MYYIALLFGSTVFLSPVYFHLGVVVSLLAVVHLTSNRKIVSAYDQEIPQSLTTDNPMAP